MQTTASAGLSEDAWDHAFASAALLNGTTSPRLQYLVLSNLEYLLIESSLLEAARSLGDHLSEFVNTTNSHLLATDLALLEIDLSAKLGDQAGVRKAADLARKEAERLEEAETREQYFHAIDFGFARALSTTSRMEGIRALDRIVDRLSALARPLQLSEAYLLRGRAWAALGDNDRAETDWAAGLRILEEERSAIGSSRLAIARADRQWDIYAALIQHHREDPIRSLAVAERARAHSLLDHSATNLTAELDLKWLPAGTTVISYAVLDGSLARWTLTREAGITLDILKTPRGGLEPLVTRFVESLATSAHATTDDRLSLLALPSELPAGTQRLVVIPDGPLHRLPFAALTTRNGARLLDEVEVSVAPSLAWLKDGIRRTRGRGTSRALLVGFADGQPAARLAPLPLVDEEISVIAREYGMSATTLIGASATRDLVIANAPLHDIIHIAGHALAEPLQPWTSRLFLAPSKDGSNSINVEDIARLPLRPQSIVILSACSTAAGRVFRGEGVISLAKPFLRAGAGAVVASLWPVRDDAAARTMAALHVELRRGLSPSAALTVVQRAEQRVGAVGWQPWIVLGWL